METTLFTTGSMNNKTKTLQVQKYYNTLDWYNIGHRICKLLQTAAHYTVDILG